MPRRKSAKQQSIKHQYDCKYDNNYKILVFAGIVMGLSACGETEPAPVGATPPVNLPPPMDPLPPTDPTETDRFATSNYCNQCHLAGDAAVMHDAAGEDISPAYLWRSSMMAFAARDPYYLAVFSEEILRRPDAQADIEAICTRCHAPAGSLEHEQTGGRLSFESLTTGTSPEDNLARDGITCSLCHQIQDIGLGKTSSFAGGFTVGFERQMFGPHQGPAVNPMQFFLNYTPVYSDHIASSEICATCHTVIVPITDASGAPTGGDFLEQAPYLEWLNSDYGGVPCQACHTPARDENDVPITSPISKYPEGLGTRQPFGKHGFSGGNSYMLGLLAENIEWTGSDVSAAELETAAERGEEHLRSAAEIAIASVTPEGDHLLVDVEITNKTGHKFPTGYPSRRAFIQFRAEDQNGNALLESGLFNEMGALVDAAGKRLDPLGSVLPHHDMITSSAEVQVYEAVAADANGKPTHLALEATHFVKDNRVLPSGFSDSHAWIDWIAPKGVGGDPSFTASSDRITYRVPSGGMVRRIEAKIFYQSIPPSTLDALSVVPTPAAVRFSQMARAKSPLPVQVASIALDL
ncbi:MAG: hypothetical protein L6Q76_08960 [Polyangiaceae bacterium]|nr:hypothetical protein [Polyangiaceae bacterium]